VPFASLDAGYLKFARTRTRIGEGYRLAIAYVPGRALYYRAIPLHEKNENCVNPDVVLVALAP